MHIHAFLTSALDSDKLSDSPSGHLVTGEGNSCMRRPEKNPAPELRSHVLVLNLTFDIACLRVLLTEGSPLNAVRRASFYDIWDKS